MITAFVQDKTTIERGLFDEELVPEELTQVRMGKIVGARFPELDAEDQEAVRQHAVAALNLTQKAKEIALSNRDDTETTGNTALIDGVRKFAMDVRELDIEDLLGREPVIPNHILLAKNIVRSHLGREWMAIRDMDVAAAVIGIRPMYAKLSAFAVSSFIIGVAGGLWGFVHLGSWEPAAFSIDRSFQLLFMVIIGGMGSIMGSFFGAAFIVVLPIFLNQFLPALGALFGVEISTAGISHTEFMVFGALIVWFLIVEPHGLAKLWSIGKQKLRLWPFPH